MKYNGFDNVETFKEIFIATVENQYAIDFKDSTPYQQYVALGEMLRLKIADDWKETNKKIYEQNLKKIYYFSMEFLMGRIRN